MYNLLSPLVPKLQMPISAEKTFGLPATVEATYIHTVKFILNTPPGTFGPTLIRGGGGLKRQGNMIIFLPPKIHF